MEIAGIAKMEWLEANSKQAPPFETSSLKSEFRSLLPNEMGPGSDTVYETLQIMLTHPKKVVMLVP
jgi:hypothetical protein